MLLENLLLWEAGHHYTNTGACLRIKSYGKQNLLDRRAWYHLLFSFNFNQNSRLVQLTDVFDKLRKSKIFYSHVFLVKKMYTWKSTKPCSHNWPVLPKGRSRQQQGDGPTWLQRWSPLPCQLFCIWKPRFSDFVTIGAHSGSSWNSIVLSLGKKISSYMICVVTHGPLAIDIVIRFDVPCLHMYHIWLQSFVMDVTWRKLDGRLGKILPPQTHRLA